MAPSFLQTLGRDDFPLSFDQSYVPLPEPEPTALCSLIPASRALLGKSSSGRKGWSSSIIHRQDQKRPFHFRSVSQLQWRHTSVSAHLVSSIPGDALTSEQLFPVTSGDMRTRAEANARQTRALLCTPTGEYVQFTFFCKSDPGAAR